MFKSIMEMFTKSEGAKAPPVQVGGFYHHRERDPLDIIAYVEVQEYNPETGQVLFYKHYKPGQPPIRPYSEKLPLRQFKKWFREGM